MEFICTSRHLRADYFTALDVAGREYLVVVAKASWSLPQPEQRPRPLPPQPLHVSDAYHGEPGESAMRVGDDHVRYKPRCDVLFESKAHSPTGKPVTELDVGIRVGTIEKIVRVTGDRVWRRSLSGLIPSAPEPFISMPLHFGHAFGGTRFYTSQGKRLAEALDSNPVGMGWAGVRTSEFMVGEPVANLAHPNTPIRQPDDRHVPHALGAVGRHWMPRIQYAGTYDDRWRKDIAPFLPEDFDEQFHQCAPLDQQMPYLQGAEEVQLAHLLPERPLLRFQLPVLNQLKVRILRKDFSAETLAAVADTLFFETEEQRFSVTWRASTPIRRRLQEFETVAVGTVAPDWWRMKRLGLDDLEDCAGCGPQRRFA